MLDNQNSLKWGHTFIFLIDTSCTGENIASINWKSKTNILGSKQWPCFCGVNVQTATRTNLAQTIKFLMRWCRKSYTICCNHSISHQKLNAYDFFLNRLTTQPTKRDGIKRSKRTKVRSEKTKTLLSFIKSPLPPKVVAVIGSPTLIDPSPANGRSPSYSQKSNSCTNFVAQFFHARRVWKVDALLWVVRRRRAATFDAERRRFATRGLLGLAESEDLILWYDATSSE